MSYRLKHHTASIAERPIIILRWSIKSKDIKVGLSGPISVFNMADAPIWGSYHNGWSNFIVHAWAWPLGLGISVYALGVSIGRPTCDSSAMSRHGLVKVMRPSNSAVESIRASNGPTRSILCNIDSVRNLGPAKTKLRQCSTDEACAAP
jgi:hypothetical protein